MDELFAGATQRCKAALDTFIKESKITCRLLELASTRPLSPRQREMLISRRNRENSALLAYLNARASIALEDFG